MKKYLILKGCAGLGNRLITLCNAIEYSQKSNRTLLVDWSDGQFGVKGDNVFYKFFCLKGIQYIQSIEEIIDFHNLSYYPHIWGQTPYSSLYDLYYQSSHSVFAKLLPFKLKGAITKINAYWRIKAEKDKHSIFQETRAIFDKNNIPFGGEYRIKRKENVIFFADFCPQFSPNILRNNIGLNEALLQEIENITDKLNLKKDTVGIHIRMTDKQPDSDLDQLIKKIKDRGFEKKQVFLATDNPEIENSLQGIFPNVIFLPKWRPEHIGKQMGVHQYAIRNKEYGMAEQQLKDSIIDMWLLSKCEYLIYQKNSSFSRVSAILKNDDSKTFSW